MKQELFCSNGQALLLEVFCCARMIRNSSNGCCEFQIKLSALCVCLCDRVHIFEDGGYEVVYVILRYIVACNNNSCLLYTSDAADD